ncbi:MAG: hypothetical protein H7Y32_09900, partial [Chloroflexales bacterium]|nr:hypothetical protein [Chloroflexales bacterium]
AQIITTEHFTLQTARGATISDANGRSSLFISTVSSALVALGFIGQIAEIGPLFYAFVFVIFPTLFFLGLVTFARVLQSGIEDMVYARGINRIRHLYTELAPAIKPYLILSTHDDNAGTMVNMAATPGYWQLFLTTAGMIGVVNSVLLGVIVALVVFLFANALIVAVGVGLVVFVASVALHTRYQTAQYGESTANIHVMFPSTGAMNEER